MIPLWAKALIWLGIAGGVVAGVKLGYERVKGIGYDEAKAECTAADQSATIARLESDLEKARSAANIGRLSRERIAIERGRIHVETSQSIEVVRAALVDAPVAVYPDSVRDELQARIDAANRAAAGGM